MSFEDLDEKVKQQRKKDAVEYRNKKKYSSMFMFFASVFEIIETLIVMIVLFVLVAFLMFRVFGATGDVGQTVFSIMTIADCSDYARLMLLIMGFASSFITAVFVYHINNYKRMLA